MLLSLFYCFITMVYLVTSSVSNLTGFTKTYTLLDKSLLQLKKKFHIKEQNENTQIYNSNVTKNAALFPSILLDNELESSRQKRSSCSRQKKNSRRQKRSSNSDIHRRSLCPWTNVWDMDTKRSPLFIPRAKCSSRKCNFNFTDLVIPEIVEVLTTCEPLTTDIRIYKNNEETYLEDWPVACTCSRKVVAKEFAIRNNKDCTEKNQTGLKKFKRLKKNKKGRKRKKLRIAKRRKLRRKLKKIKKRRCWRFNKEKRRFLRIFPCSKRQKYFKG